MPDTMARPTGKRLLVVLDASSPERYSPDHPVVRRAVGYARHDGQALMLLQVCYESSLTYGAFATRRELRSARSTVLEVASQKLAELRSALVGELDVPVEHDACWDADRAGAIVRKARSWNADVVLKTKRERSYVLGLFSSTDWELLRESPAPVWFVAPECRRGPEAGIVAAVDAVGDEPESDEHFALDESVFAVAQSISHFYGAPLLLVHAYQAPTHVPGFQGYAPVYPAAAAPGAAAAEAAASPALQHAREEAREALARRHGQAIQTFVDEHGIPLDDLEVLEGPTPDVIHQVAERHGAGLVVLGAGHKGRLQRLLGRVSAEPTLAESECDVLVVR
ncbi:MAG: universal stress protein [Pseudomonadota bacterium]